MDYLIKIASDGTVYGSNGKDNNGNINNPGTANEGSVSWWSASDSYKIGTVVITRENGVTTFSLKVAYSTLGIGAEDVFGVAMREASHNAGDQGGRIDAAASSQYVRVAADGTLYKAANNNKA